MAVDCDQTGAVLLYFTRHPLISLPPDDSDGVFAARIQGILDKQIAILTGESQDCDFKFTLII